jgi:hypothetical protein
MAAQLVGAPAASGVPQEMGVFDTLVRDLSGAKSKQCSG